MTSQLTQAKGLLILPRLQVQNANAISGPLTWGFPAPTAFAGFAHALERRLSNLLSHGFGGVGIICHAFDPQVYQPAGRRTQVFRLTRNPVGKDGAPTALVEEGRAHMEVSLVIAVKDSMVGSDADYFAETAFNQAQSMRLAGGSILPSRQGKRFAPRWEGLPCNQEGQADVFRRLRHQLLPGFALVQREDLLAERLAQMRDVANGQGAEKVTALDALLDLSRLNVEPIANDPEKPDEVSWQVRRRPGWLVPLPIGYAGISPLYAPGGVENSRDSSTPFRFVESLYSLGEWVSPHRLNHLQQLFWHTESDPDAGLYRCINRYSETLAATDTATLLEQSHGQERTENRLRTRF